MLRAEGELLSKISENFKDRKGRAFGTRPTKCPRCKKPCSGYEGMPPKKFSKIQNDFFDFVCISTFLFFYFEKVLFSNLKIELYENTAG